MTRVLVTGHSLGAGLATLHSLDLETHLLPRLDARRAARERCFGRALAGPRVPTRETYTFASPRVGDRTFAKWYEDKVRRSFRVVLDGDLVTNAPPAFLGYKHVGVHCVYDGLGSLIVQPHGFESAVHLSYRSSFKNHMASSYAHAIRTTGAGPSAETTLAPEHFS